MDFAKANLLCDLPTEVIQYIAEDLDTTSLRSFRRTCKHLASCGLRSLELRVPNTISNYPHRGLDGAPLIRSLVLDLQDKMPKAAAKVVALRIRYAYHPHTNLPQSLGAVRLTSLTILGLTGVIVTKRSLLAVIREHKSTLRDINLIDVALALPDSRKIGAVHKSRCWTILIDYIREKLRLDSTFLNCLTWYDMTADRSCDNHIKTTKARYHTRLLSLDYTEWFKLSNGGVQAFGSLAVRDGLREFVEEINKSLPRNPATPLSRKIGIENLVLRART